MKSVMRLLEAPGPKTNEHATNTLMRERNILRWGSSSHGAIVVHFERFFGCERGDWPNPVGGTGDSIDCMAQTEHFVGTLIWLWGSNVSLPGRCGGGGKSQFYSIFLFPSGGRVWYKPFPQPHPWYEDEGVLEAEPVTQARPKREDFECGGAASFASLTPIREKHERCGLI